VSGGGKSAADNLTALYRDSIRRHAAEPTGFRRPIAATHRHEAYNPLCGDRIEIGLRVAGDTIEEAAFDGEACAICMASASMLCGLAPGRTVAVLRQLSDDLHRALAAPVGAASAATPTRSRLKPLLHELEPLLGVRPYPSRVRCATLPWTAAVEALAGDREGSGN
jgi:nitrogen fixation protein NifU and related proteins